MSILDLLLADALAAGMARMSEKSDPENFFVLPPNLEAWRKLYGECTKESLVICVEVTKEAHPPSLNTHPHFLDLARRVPNIPFIQVKTSLFRSFDKVREDLGGVDTAPTIVIAFFDEDKVRIKRVVGEEKIKFGIKFGIIESTIKDFLEKRAKNKLAEKMAERFADALIGDIQRKRRQEYEEKLKKEKEDLDRRLKETEEQRRKEEDKQRKIEELRSMDLRAARIPDIKQKMNDLQISHVGAVTRDDLIQQIKKDIPSLSYTKTNDDMLAGYITSDRHTKDVALHAKTQGLDETTEPVSISNNDSTSMQSTRDDELLETRMLYACTLNDMDILGKIAQKEEGVVVRARCIKPGLPNPTRIYALKIIVNVNTTSTLTKVQTDFKNEYEILSGLPHHKNVIRLFAFFHDRPRAYKALGYLQDGLALCLLIENLSQDMQEHMNNLKRVKGPMASNSLHWLKDVVNGLLFLFQHHIVHRDMKLENLLLSGNSIKISDFGTSIRLDATMKLPFVHVVPRGGNEAHLAPEILTARPGTGKYLDYTKQPVWEAGVLAYELTGHESPFSQPGIDQRAYSVSSIPRLEKTYSKFSIDQEYLPNSFTVLVHSMLEYYPADRPSLDEVNVNLNHIV